MKDTGLQNLSIKHQPLHHGQDIRTVSADQGQNCRPVQGQNGLQDHWQEAVSLQ